MKESILIQGQIVTKGTRIQCKQMDDPFHPIPKGMLGEVLFIDDIGTIHMCWENGSTLGLIPDKDCFEIINQSHTI